MKDSYRPEGNQCGVTLVELVVAIVVITVAFSGVFLVVNMTTIGSVDPMVRHQALAIAEAHLEEILLKSFEDPDSLPESNRAEFDDVDNYNGLDDNGARDQEGNAIAGLSPYRVQVAVTGEALGGITSADSKRVTVTVTHTLSGEVVSLSGFRLNY